MASFPIGISAWCRLVSSERAVCSELGACEHPKDPWLFISRGRHDGTNKQHEFEQVALYEFGEFSDV